MLPVPLTPGQLRSVALLLALMLLSALAEGLGLVMLVPMLAVLGEDGGSGDRVVQAVGQLGIPLTLPWLLGVFVALVALRALVNFWRSVESFRLQVAVVDELRARAWRALLHCDWRRLSGMRQSDNASMLITDIDRVGFGLDQWLTGLATALTLCGVGLAALAISPLLAVSAFAIGAAVLVAYRGMRRRAEALGDELSRAYARFHTRLTEGLQALRVVKSFGREEREAQEGLAAVTGLRRTQFAYIRDAGLAQAALQVGGAALLAGLVWLAIGKWESGPAQIIPLVALFARALPLLERLQRSWQDWSHAAPAARSALALISRAEAAREEAAPAGIVAPTLAEMMEIDGVTVRFENRDRPALHDVSLTLPAGSITAVTGPSGAGKSTLADLMGGLIAPNGGSLKVDGLQLEGGLRRAWREHVTYVQQEPVLFSGSLRDNFLWACPGAGEDRIRQCLQVASAEFVHDLPEGLDTRVGEHGRQLSGGERQRIVLARALMRDPRLLILDEASSALDHENEAAVARAVAQLRGKMTIVVIGHRGALCALADRTVALSGGRITQGAA